MTVKTDEVFEMAIDFLENGGKVPDDTKANDRFLFLAAILRRMHSQNMVNRDISKGNKKNIERLTIAISAMGGIVLWQIGVEGQWEWIIKILALLGL